MQVHTKNKKRKQYLRNVYPDEKYNIPQNPNELEYRIMNAKEQKIKRYDFLFLIVVWIVDMCKNSYYLKIENLKMFFVIG